MAAHGRELGMGRRELRDEPIVLSQKVALGITLLYLLYGTHTMVVQLLREDDHLSRNIGLAFSATSMLISVLCFPWEAWGILVLGPLMEINAINAGNEIFLKRPSITTFFLLFAVAIVLMAKLIVRRKIEI